MKYKRGNKLENGLQPQSECEGCVQKHSQPQRIENEPVIEILQNITSPRGPSIGQDMLQKHVINRYAELHRNGVETRIKSLVITH